MGDFWNIPYEPLIESVTWVFSGTPLSQIQQKHFITSITGMHIHKCLYHIDTFWFEILRCYFQVEFIAEEAIDAGGLTKVCKIFTLTHCVHSPLLISVAISFQVVFLGEEAIDEGGLRKVSLVPYYMIIIHVGCLCLNFFHLLAQKPNLEKYSIYSSKFFYNFHLSESSFTCPGLQASGLAKRLCRWWYFNGMTLSSVICL
jgi:hypothetical protein